MSETTTQPGGAPEAGQEQPSAADTTTDLGPNGTPLDGSEGAEGNDGDQPEGQPAAAPPPKFVPHAALHEAREQGRELREQLKAEREARQRLELRTDELLQHFRRPQQPQPQQPPQAEPAIPDINTDPVGHFQARNELLERRLAELAQPVQAQQQRDAFLRGVTAQVNEFSRTVPDYGPAYAHAVKVMQDHAVLWGMDPSVAEVEFARAAAQRGVNVGQAVYEFAKRTGYGAAPAAPAAPPAAPAAPQPGTPPSMEAVRQGRAAARTAGAGGQPGGGNPLTPERLAQMSPKELAALPEADFRRAMGG